MTAATDEFVHCYWHNPTRMAFPCGTLDVHLTPSKPDGTKNRLARKLWDAISTGVGRRYVEKKMLVLAGGPIDGEAVVDADVRRGIIETRASRRARLRDEEASTISELRAELAAIKATMASPAPRGAEPPFDPSDHSVEEIAALAEAANASEVRALIMAEAMGKGRASALAALSKALNS